MQEAEETVPDGITARELTEMLDGSAIHLDDSRDLEAALTAMLANATTIEQVAKTFGANASLLSGLVAGLLFVGASAATAASIGGWSPWAERPDFSYTITLPSGDQCEIRYGLMSTNPGPVAPIDSNDLDPDFASWLASADLLGAADVDGVLRQMEAGEFLISIVDSDGGLLPESPDNWSRISEDFRYEIAVSTAVGDVVEAELYARGFTGLTYGSEKMCTEVGG